MRSKPGSAIASGWGVALAAEGTLSRIEQPLAEVCEYIGPQGWYWSKGRSLFHSEGANAPLRYVGTVPAQGVPRVVGRLRLGRRMLRQQFYNVLPLASGDVFYSFGTRIGIIGVDGHREVSGRARESRVLRGGMARLPGDAVVFGEYFDNAERSSVNIYRFDPELRKVEVVHAFAPGEIRHVHSVSWDHVEGRVVVAAGDIGKECMLLSFGPEFGDCRELGSGHEGWRAISVRFTESAIYFGTDAQYRPNAICRLDRTTGRVAELCAVNGPVFYSAPVSGGWIFSTAAEMCESQTSPYAVMYFVDPRTETVSEVGKFEKDRLSTKYFQFGLLSFPIIEMAVDALPLAGTALRGLGRGVLQMSGLPPDA